MLENDKAGLFDSGLGGLTVLKEIKKVAPNLDIIYFGDNKNAPYGQKTQEEIIDLTEKAFAFLKKKGALKIVTACNSVSTVVNLDLAERVGLDRENIIEMSLPTVKHCLENELKNILILSTQATKDSGMYQEQFFKNGIEVKSWAINGLVDLIESGAGDEEKEVLIKRELEDLNLNKYNNIILACTHFPLVENIFQKVFEDGGSHDFNFINPAVFVAEEVKSKFGSEGSGKIKFYFSNEEKIDFEFIKSFIKNK